MNDTVRVSDCKAATNCPDRQRETWVNYHILFGRLGRGKLRLEREIKAESEEERSETGKGKNQTGKGKA